MKEVEPLKPDKVYKLWESTKDLVPFSAWLPEVVGPTGELIQIGSIPVDLPKESAIPETVKSEVRFIDSDVSKYRKLLSMFRSRHPNSVKNNR